MNEEEFAGSWSIRIEEEFAGSWGPEFPKSWRIEVRRADGKVAIEKCVPNDELEYGIDDALRDAREEESKL